MPWLFKIMVKIVLSRAPIDYPFWRRLGVFRHGFMDQGSYALSKFNEHISRAGLQGKLQGKTILELGPGDSIATALIAACYGAKTILIDAGSFATNDLSVYRRLAYELECINVSPPDISKAETLDGVLDACNGSYLTHGLNSFSTIKTGTIDLIFSEAVLEHIRKHEFQDMVSECFRVLAPEGVSSHTVDLKDHIGGSLNNLRFAEHVWESEFFVRSGFYTNRIRYPEMITIFEELGFKVDIRNVRKWDHLPLNKRCLAKSFSHFSDEDLVVKVFDVLLQKKN
jgi:SAM-dependent methyltransferase